MADTRKIESDGTGAPRPDRTRVIKLHHLRPAPGAKKAKTRVGRGEGSKGKTAGRGTKGTKARRQRETLRTLGLRKIRQSVVREDTPSVRGMIATVHHLVTVEEA